MGTLLVSEIFERTGRILLDEGGVRWGSAELLDWYNEGLLDMVTRRPGLLPSVDDVVLVAGTQQVLTTDRLAIIDVGQNIGSVAKPRNGQVPNITPKDTMDRLIPDWQYQSSSVMVITVVTHQQTPRIFWVYPPQPTVNPGRLRMIQSKRPTVVSATSAAFEPDDQYMPIMIEYLLYRAFSKDAENPSSGQRSAQHLQNYLGLLGAGAPQPQQG
jgi:hypothetical protein